MAETPNLVLRGVRIHQGYLDADAQQTVLGALREVTACAPMGHPGTRRGLEMSVKMTSAGEYGWVSHRRG